MLAILFSERLTEALGSKGVTREYESRLFDASEIVSIDMIMDGDKWDEMLENANLEEYYHCDVVINGGTFNSVGIRPKGNTGLTSIVNEDEIE